MGILRSARWHGGIIKSTRCHGGEIQPVLIGKESTLLHGGRVTETVVAETVGTETAVAETVVAVQCVSPFVCEPARV